MAALFRMPFALPTVAEPTTAAPSLAKSNLPLLQSPRSYHLPAYPMEREWDERQRRSTTGASTEARIAHWDKKREKCANCKHIYLKTLSRHAGFCSVDCKSNAAYIDKVNRTIKAVRSAVEHRQQQENNDAEAAATKQETEATTSECDSDADAPVLARTFAEFGLEARLPTDQHVEWAFSAIY